VNRKLDTNKNEIIVKMKEVFLVVVLASDIIFLPVIDDNVACYYSLQGIGNFAE